MKKNSLRITFCPGPGAVIPEWSKGQTEFFGRGDNYYSSIKEKTLNWIKKISQQNNVIPIAGSGTTAAIIAFNTFLKGKVCIVKTGYYSDRWYNYLKKTKSVKKIKYLTLENLKNKKTKFDWVIFVYVETASCKKFDIKKAFLIKKKTRSKLMVDATASIGLENYHNLADVIFFSSCKGLFGPTGLGFVAYKSQLKKIKSKDFWYDYETHEKSKYTLGYNCIAALEKISSKHSKFKKKLIFAKNFMKKYTLNQIHSPNIGIGLKKKINKKKVSKNTLLYVPRKKIGYDTIFFLGMIKFSKSQIKKYLKSQIINKLIN